MGLRERAVVGTAIDGLVVISLKQVDDERGTIREYHRASDESWGPWPQVNVTETNRGALRGLHGEDMTKLVGVVAGEAFGAYVDTRPSSPTRGAVVTVPLVAGHAGAGAGGRVQRLPGPGRRDPVPLLLRRRVGAGHGRGRRPPARPGPRHRVAARGRPARTAASSPPRTPPSPPWPRSCREPSVTSGRVTGACRTHH